MVSNQMADQVTHPICIKFKGLTRGDQDFKENDMKDNFDPEWK
jgi:hypothetical protein